MKLSHLLVLLRLRMRHTMQKVQLSLYLTKYLNSLLMWGLTRTMVRKQGLLIRWIVCDAPLVFSSFSFLFDPWHWWHVQKDRKDFFVILLCLLSCLSFMCCGFVTLTVSGMFVPLLLYGQNMNLKHDREVWIDSKFKAWFDFLNPDTCEIRWWKTILVLHTEAGFYCLFWIIVFYTFTIIGRFTSGSILFLTKKRDAILFGLLFTCALYGSLVF